MTKQETNRHRLNRFFDRLFSLVGLFTTVFGIGVLIVLLVDTFMDALPRLDWQFLTNFPSRRPEKAGALSAWVGTLVVMVVTIILAFPLGVAAATYLEEFSRKNKLTEFIEINIANLAAVPSIIYGLLGLEFFVRVMRLERSIISGALTLAILILPLIIVSTREALRAIPPTIREASYALGATRWQTVRNQILPAAMPAILTGTILAISRAIGEAAPLIMIGALTYVAFLPVSPITPDFPFLSFRWLLDPFTVLPIQIFNWVSRPQHGFFTTAAAGIILLLVIVFILNGIAAYIRHRYEKRIRW
jgi:phosphate transport system permease protein